MNSLNWMFDIEKCIGVDDNIRESYYGWLNDEYVHMVFTEKKILIIEDSTIGVQKTKILLNLPYYRIKKVALEKPDIIFSKGLSFTDYVDFKRVFISENESAQEIEKKLLELMRRSVTSLSVTHTPYS